MKAIISIALIFTLIGCASIYTQTHDAYVDASVSCSDSKTIPNLYSGTVFDLFCLPAENAGFFCLLDLPLSAVIDTVIAPYTIYKQSQYGSWYSQAECKSRSQAETPEKNSDDLQE